MPGLAYSSFAATRTDPANRYSNNNTPRQPSHRTEQAITRVILYTLFTQAVRKPFELRLRITNLKNVLHITVLFSVTITAVELFVWRREEHKTHSRGFTGVIQWRN